MDRVLSQCPDGFKRMVMLSLAEASVDYMDKHMIIPGAGAAAISVAVQAALDDVRHITIFNRKDPFFDVAEERIS